MESAPINYYSVEELSASFNIPISFVEKRILQGECRAGVITTPTWEATYIYKDSTKDDPNIRSLKGLWFLYPEDAEMLLTQKNDPRSIEVVQLQHHQNSKIESALLVGSADRTIRDKDIVIGEDDFQSLISAFKKNRKAILAQDKKKSSLSEATLYNICCEVVDAINNSETVNKLLETPIVCPQNATENERLEKIKNLLVFLASNIGSCRRKSGKPLIGSSSGGIIRFLDTNTTLQYGDSTYQNYFRQALNKK